MQLPLHDGKAPRWLVERMKMLSYLIVKAIVLEHGYGTLLARLSDPLWFQAFGCVLGYDWHSSGVTTVVTGVLKQALAEHDHDLGLMVAGGKGKSAFKACEELVTICDTFNIRSSKMDELLYASKMTAKVDSILLQDKHELYHHAMLVAEDGTWAVVQQGMDVNAKTARRYHWLNAKRFVDEPRSGIIGSSVLDNILDMTAKESGECRKVCVDIANEKNVISSVQLLFKQSVLDTWIDRYDDNKHCNSNSNIGDGRGNAKAIEIYVMPEHIDWDVFKRIYDVHPSNYEELVAVKGVGASTIRALALVAELIYGARPSWRDPVKFTFAHGGKDGVPYPVDRRTYDESIKVLREAIEGLDVDHRVRKDMLMRLC